MKVVITGGSGRLGKDLFNVFERDHTVSAPSRKELEITSFEQVNQYFDAVQPEILIHSAAMADADVCQLDPAKAFWVNTMATQNLALACQKHRTTMVFISTDYVFDGTSGTPYTEFDLPNPINVYGKTKLAAEKFIEQSVEKNFIIRTAWLFGAYAPNFLSSVLDAARTGQPMRAAFDQSGSPTSTIDLSEAILELVNTPFYGIYNIVNRGGLTWYEYARLILTIARTDAMIEPIRKEQRGPAPRPGNTILNPLSLDLRGIYNMPEISDAISRCVYSLRK